MTAYLRSPVKTRIQFPRFATSESFTTTADLRRKLDADNKLKEEGKTRATFTERDTEASAIDAKDEHLRRRSARLAAKSSRSYRICHYILDEDYPVHFKDCTQCKEQFAMKNEELDRLVTEVRHSLDDHCWHTIMLRIASIKS